MREAREISDWNDCELAEILIINSRNVAINFPGEKKAHQRAFCCDPDLMASSKNSLRASDLLHESLLIVIPASFCF
jgi:hypothetical protein